MLYSKEIDKMYTYDVIVVGSGPSGICAAISAARQGAKTLLIERFGVLGGMMTVGHVGPILGSVSHGTMYDELMNEFRKLHPEIKPDVTRNGMEAPIDPEEVKVILPTLLKANNVDFFLQTPVVDTIVEDNVLTTLIISMPSGLACVQAKCFVDCSGDGYVSASAGVKYELGRSVDGKCQPLTIEFVLTSVDETRAITCYGGSDPVTLQDGKKYSDLCKEANARGELPQNVTIVRLHRNFYIGERSVNATQANGYDSLTLEGISKAELDLREQIFKVIAFLRKYVPGYEDCRTKSSASALGVRETRRIIGEYILSDKDVENGARFTDVIVHKAWFLIDIHNPIGGGQAEKYSQPAKPYDIPYRCFVPKDVDNLLVAGRCISGTHRAHASYRVMGICMAMGEAAGVAAALCTEKSIAPRKLDAIEVQRTLLQRGVGLFDE